MNSISPKSFLKPDPEKYLLGYTVQPLNSAIAGLLSTVQYMY